MTDWFSRVSWSCCAWLSNSSREKSINTTERWAQEASAVCNKNFTDRSQLNTAGQCQIYSAQVPYTATAQNSGTVSQDWQLWKAWTNYQTYVWIVWFFFQKCHFWAISNVQWWKQISTHFSDSTHQECMIFARTGHGSCYLLPLKWDLRRCVGPWSRVKVCRSKLCFFQNDPLMGGHKNPVLPSPPHSPPKSDIINALSLLNEAYNTRKHLQAYGTDCSYLCSA